MRALVWSAPASEPAFGSESENAPSISPVASLGRKCFFCASVPNFAIGAAQTELCTERITESAAETRATSSSVMP